MHRFYIRTKHCLFYQLIFIAIVAITFLYLYSSHTVPSFVYDGSFHYRRLYDIAHTLIHGQLPQFTNYITIFYGGGVSTFYPWVLLAPFSLLILILKPVTFMLLLMSLILLIMLECSYFASQTYFHNQFKSFTFAILFVMSSLTLCRLVIDTDIGESLAIGFLPLIFFGWLAFMKYYHTRMILIGLTLVTLVHVPSTFIDILFLLLFTVLDYQHTTKRHYKLVLILGLNYLLLTCFIWLPMIILWMTNQLTFPYVDLRYSSLLHQLFGGCWFSPRVAIIDYVTFALGLFLWKDLNTLYHKGLIFNIVLYFIANDYFTDIFLMKYTFLYVIQDAYRLLFLNHLITVVILIKCIDILQVRYHWSFSNMRNFCKNLLILVMIDYIFLLFMVSFLTYPFNNLTSSSYSYKYRYNYYQDVNNYLKHIKSSKHHIKVMHKAFKPHSDLPNYNYRYNFIKLDYCDYNILNNNVFTHYRFLYNTPVPDYYPKTIMNHYVLYRLYHWQPYHTIYKPDQLLLQAKHPVTTWIPYATYNTQQYHVYDNHRLVPHSIKHHVIYVHLHKGNNNIQVTEPIMWYRWLSIMISILGACDFGLIDFAHRYRQA